jgi:Protein of unknown function (DUF3617)
MRRSPFAGVIALASTAAFAAGFGLKPGLWEMHMIKQVTDGHDLSAEVAAASAHMEQMLANMPADQRARVQAMMKQSSAVSLGNDGTIRMCISPEMASRDTPIVDREGHCQPGGINRSGNRTTFDINCKMQGNEVTGKGESVSTGDLITTKVDTTTHDAKGATHVMHTETELKYLGSDCGDVKPITPAK